ncbi:sigma 54-interacting transcriptional regulator, partial [Ectothiorhodospiraceae bacterium WFHF3C12]|nr:sigma 54-interacting transcriptional regulator [Ectothiorhodospiraceae bacterium WFHF3C12]
LHTRTRLRLGGRVSRRSRPIRPPEEPAEDGMVASALQQARRVLARDIPVLVEGETGTGKEYFARRLHEGGPHAAGEFVAVNCAALPESLIESELFGYAPGAFTGARREGHPGKLAEADGGTLFLDEIGDMPLALQSRLLRVLQERQIVPVGGSRPLRVEFTLISATHRDLRQLVAAGEFRSDLYYRLNGLRVALPPLRERSDLRALVQKLLHASEPGAEIDDDALSLLLEHPWPGNCRQLEFVLRTALALREGDGPLQAHHLPDDFRAELSAASSAGGLQAAKDNMIREAVEAHGGNVAAAARALGINRSTIYRRLRE